MNVSKQNQRTMPAVGIKSRRADTHGSDAASIGFVRVRKRKLKGSQRAAYGRSITSSASFEIVRAVRVDGRSTHRFVLGLGSQKSIDPAGPCWFWLRAIRRMIEHGLTTSERFRLLAEMLRKGARPPGFACHQGRSGRRQSDYMEEIDELRRFMSRADLMARPWADRPWMENP